MLEFSRKDGRLNFIETSRPTLRFSLLSMELHLGIRAARTNFEVLDAVVLPLMA